jgi:hypothetical protein
MSCLVLPCRLLLPAWRITRFEIAATACAAMNKKSVTTPQTRDTYDNCEADLLAYHYNGFQMHYLCLRACTSCLTNRLAVPTCLHRALPANNRLLCMQLTQKIKHVRGKVMALTCKTQISQFIIIMQAGIAS